MEGKKKYTVRFAVLATLVVGVIASVIYVLSMKATGAVDAALEYRGVETFAKKWLNGHLGHFFQFKHFGNLSWLAIPVVMGLLYKHKQRTRWEWAFLFFYFIAVIIVSVQGWQTYRYKYTIFILVVPFVLYYLYKAMSDEKWKHLRGYMLLLLAVLSVYNCWFYGTLKFYAVYMFYFIIPLGFYMAWVFYRSKKYKRLGLIAALLMAGGSAFITVRMLRKGPAEALDKIAKRSFMYRELSNDLFAYLDELDLNGRAVLTNNSPNIYYYTDAKAIYYKGVMDWSYHINGNITGGNDLSKVNDGTSGGRTPAQVRQFVLDSLECDYVLTSSYQDKFNATFKAFVAEHCDTVMNDMGYVLAKIRK